MSANCTCVLAKPAGMIGLSTAHTALCMQQGNCQQSGTPVAWKPAGLFFREWKDAAPPLTSLRQTLAFAKLSFTQQTHAL